MKIPVAKALFNSHSYSEYRKLVSDLLLEGKSTGNEQSEDLIHYTTLNETRMNRLDKTIKITDENSRKLKSLDTEYIWLVISEGWCGDAAQLLPIINKMALQSDNIDLRIVLRDENEELMNFFLTNKSKAISILIFVDKNFYRVIFPVIAQCIACAIVEAVIGNIKQQVEIVFIPERFILAGVIRCAWVRLGA